MKILTRFLIRHFSYTLALCSMAFVGIYLLIDFFEKIDDFIDHKAVPADYLNYLFNSTPFILSQILPLAMLTAVVLTLGGLGRTNEITAIRACGISLWKIVRPFMALALLLSLTLLLLNEYVVPWNIRQLNTLFEVKLKGRQVLSLTHQEIWYRQDNNIINIALAKPQQHTLMGVRIFTFDDQQKLTSRTDIPDAHFSDNRWMADQAILRTFSPETGDLISSANVENQTLPIKRTPDDFSGRNELSTELNFSQLKKLAEKLEREGYDSIHQRVDMHARIAAPFTCLIMGFLGVPFALQRGRNSNIALGIGLSLGIGIVYFILQSLVTAFGYSGAFPPAIAAWTANIIFLMLGVWLLLNVKE